jgi:hypothetical protein
VHNPKQPTPLAAEGGWGLYEQVEGTPDYIQGTPYLWYLWHDCPQAPGWWTARRDYYKDLSWPCYNCKLPVPAGLQALFVLLTGDMDHG